MRAGKAKAMKAVLALAALGAALAAGGAQAREVKLEELPKAEAPERSSLWLVAPEMAVDFAVGAKSPARADSARRSAIVCRQTIMGSSELLLPDGWTLRETKESALKGGAARAELLRDGRGDGFDAKSTRALGGQRGCLVLFILNSRATAMMMNDGSMMLFDKKAGKFSPDWIDAEKGLNFYVDKKTGEPYVESFLAEGPGQGLRRLELPGGPKLAAPVAEGETFDGFSMLKDPRLQERIKAKLGK